MGEVKWTQEQLLAIKEKGKNILVAAAAGSGKTAVLVERIINKIINEKIDIDKILVVTFTKSAASEMRGRILDAIYDRIEKNPEDTHLQKQITLLSKANICTIDSFCLDVVKNNFFEIDISPNLKIAENTEIEILKQETLENLFEEKYETNDKDFLDLINIYTNYRGDEILQELILEIYKFIQSMPFPEKWLKERVEMFNTDEISFEKTIWGQILFSKVKESLQDGILKLESIINNIKFEENVDELINLLSEDMDKIKLIFEKNSWDEVYDEIKDNKFRPFTRSKKIPEDIKLEVKEKRDEVKKTVNDLEKNILVCNSENAIKDIRDMYGVLLKIEKLVLEFSNAFLMAKQDKNIMDFNDIEHYALNILYKSDEENYVAKKYQDKYEEILIDEYQDSNLVQEYILNAISRKNNIFMVGDVKQSIYKFRGARPELFLDKYRRYTEKDLSDSEGLKIQLFKNFRSRKNVLDITNIIFSDIMSKDLGDIEYDENEYLNLGAEYLDGNNLETELHVIDLKEDDTSDEEDGETERVEDIVLEAKFVANKIKELIDSKYLVYNKDKTYREITYKDIVVLLRSAQGVAPIYEQEISKLNLPVFCDITVGYLDTMEIQVIMSLLNIIDNPINDIALVTVLRSPIGNFTDNELIEVRLENKNKTFYDAMCEFIKLENAKKDLKEKIESFLKQIDEFRKCQEYMPLDELIWKIYTDTGYYNYVSLMPNGTLRVANLKILFEKAKQYEQTSFKGLYNFIRFIDRLKLSNKDMTGAKLIGENEDVIRIMSIHKSKGLEFPVVFLSSTGKRFNVRDINSNPILLHQDIGIGPKYINYEKGIRYNTLAREAVKYKSREEMISEEMRILYVALTRAKEKLIITGMDKDYKKSIDSKEDLLSMYKDAFSTKKINKNIIENNLSYLAWIELVCLNSKSKLDKILNIYTYKKENLVKELVDVESDDVPNLMEKLDKIEAKDIENIKNKLDWKYEYKIANNILTKNSVTRLKNIHPDEDDKFVEYDVPKFLKTEKKITATQKGTLMHLVLQKLNEKIDYDEEKIKELLDKLEERNVISNLEKNAIDVSKIYEFTCSNIWKELQNARIIEREKPFYINISAKEAYGEDIDEDILVQGIIDLYYITDDERVILVDYKTDRLNDEKEFVVRYKKQLDIYKMALEQSLEKKVDKTYIYATNLGKTIEI